MLTCAVMSAALASAMMSRTGSSFGLPSKVIAPRVIVKVFPSRSTLPRICSSEPFITGAALVPEIVQLAAPFALESVARAQRCCPGMSIVMSSIRRKRRWLVRRLGWRLLPGLAVGLDDLQHDDLWREAFRELISARLTVRGAVTFGAVRGPTIDTVPLAVGDRLVARRATRKLANVAESSAVGPEAPLSATLPCALRLPLALSSGRKRGQSVTRSRFADEIGLHLGQNRSRREILVARVGKSLRRPFAAGAATCAANRNIGGEAGRSFCPHRAAAGRQGVSSCPAPWSCRLKPAFRRHRDPER